MAIVPLQLARVSNTLRTNVASSALSRTQAQLLRVQNELTTGKRLNAPSDDPGAAAIAQQIRKTLEQRLAFEQNLKHASNQLAEVDSSLGELTNQLDEAQSIASANVGSDVPVEQRQGAAEIVGRIYSQALSLANKQFAGSFLFAGDRLTDAPFVESNGGVRFVGSATLLRNQYDENAVLPFQVSGAEIFGALSTRVEGTVDLTPAAALDTRLSDLRGTTGNGVARGIIRISNGVDPAVNLNLADAETLGDVVNRINTAGLGLTASIAPGGAGLLITGTPAHDLVIDDVGGGTTARDLGILQVTPQGAGVPITGSPVKPLVTGLTRLADLRGGAGIDTAGGLVLSNGQTSETIDLSAAITVEDLLNRVNSSTTGIRAEINAAGNGVNFFNPVQGVSLSIAENGGSTATDLGIRSFAPETRLVDLNAGIGLRTVVGPDLRLTDSAGNSVDIDLTGLNTVQDVLDAINSATSGAGVLVTATFSTTGNGIVLTDGAGGAGTLSAMSLNASSALKDLGLNVAAVGVTITGRDVAPVEAKGIFANLAALRAALQSNDQQAITRAAEGLKQDHGRVVRARGSSAALVQELESRQERLADQNVATKALLSELEDTDFNDAIIRFQTLQTSLEASMRTIGATLQLSLLDFLR
jgi:flagellar hook-associated protein 3 FlgL